MECLLCHAKLTKQDVCLQCGTDIRLYREIIQTSNLYYNVGLERAKRRDLTGAMTALHQCLNLNKKNIDARNLLGLIYFEIGELVFALREWVISKNMQEKDNLASYYLEQAESTQKGLAAAIHRYNNALHYLEIGSRDLALIQLKRITAKPYHVVKAYQLLALLYMQDGMYQKAERLLKRCIAIDNGDSTAFRYMEALTKRKQNMDMSLSDAWKEATQSQDDVIIPVATKEINSYFVYVMYMVLGFILGTLLIYFIAVPSAQRIAQSDAAQLLKDSELTIVSLRTEIVTLEGDKQQLQNTIEELQKRLETHEEDVGLTVEEIAELRNKTEQYQKLLGVLEYYLAEDYLAAMSAYLDLDSELEDEVYASVYHALKRDMDTNIWYRLYTTGMKYLEAEEYTEVIPLLAQARMLNQERPEIGYYLGYCYEMTDQEAAMLECYQWVISNFAGTTWAEQSLTRMTNYYNMPE